MNFKALIRGVAHLVFALALLATAATLNTRRNQPANDPPVQASPSTDDNAAELARCRALGREAANDAACKAAWQTNRERFLNSEKLDPEHLTTPAAASPKTSTSALAGQLTKSAAAPAKR